MSKKRYGTEQQRLAQQARDLAAGCSALFHGTRYPNMIFSSGVLRPATVGDHAVCLSRSPEAAAYWATTPRDNDEGRGAIFVFDRQRLSMRYRLELIDDSVHIIECEERISGRNVSLRSSLVGFVSQTQQTRTTKERRRAANEVSFRSFETPRGTITTTRAIASLGKDFETQLIEAVLADSSISNAQAGTRGVVNVGDRIVSAYVKSVAIPGFRPARFISVALAHSAHDILNRED